MARKPAPKNIPELPTMIKGDVLLPAPDPAYTGRLMVIKGGEEGFELLLPRGVTSIGRAADNDVVLTDLASSRKHAQLVWQDELFRLKDLDSGNGTLLNGKRVTQVELRHGDIFEIGATQIKLEMFAPAEAGYIPQGPPVVAPAPRLPPSPVAQNPTVGLPGLSLPNGRGGVGAPAAPLPVAPGQAGGVLFPTPGVLPGALPPGSASGTGGVIPPGHSGAGQLPGPFGQVPSPMTSEQAAPAVAAYPPSAYAETPPPPPRPPAPPPNFPPLEAPVSRSSGGVAAVLPSASAALPVAPPVQKLRTGPGWATTLSSMVEGISPPWLYGALGLSGLALLAALFLLVWQSGKSTEEVAVERFQAGLAAYVTRDWAKAQGAFEEALSLSPEFTEAKQYTLLTRNEKAISTRFEEARKLSSGGASRDQTLVALTLARSIPPASLYGEDAARLEREARRAWISSIRVEVEDFLRQRPQKLGEAAKTLLQTEQILGEIPASIADLTQSLEKEANTKNWRELAQDLVEAPGSTTSSSAEEIPAPPIEEIPTEGIEENPPPKETSTSKTPTPKSPNTPLSKASKNSILSLYNNGKFSAAIEEAKRMGNREGDDLARRIGAFQKSYTKGKSTYDSGGRSTAYGDLRDARGQDNKISKGNYRAEINKMLAPCASAQAEFYFNTAKSRSAYSDYRKAYTLAKEALSIDSSLKESQKIITAIDTLAESKWKEEQRLEGKGKVDQAIALCDQIMQMLPSSKGRYNDAKKAKEKLLRFK